MSASKSAREAQSRAGTQHKPVRRAPTVAFVVASLDILGGHGIQAKALTKQLDDAGWATFVVAINPRFPMGLRWIRKAPYLRTFVNEALYLLTLPRLMRADVVHVFCASYFSFLLGPVPALLCARLMRKRLILNYHSGEAEDHLARWGILVHPFLRLADEIVVPSPFLHEVFARFGYDTRVIENIVETSAFRFRERPPSRLRLLSARNLEPHYRVGDIVQAFVLLRTRHPEAELVIAGSGSEEQELRKLAQNIGVEGISFTGRYAPARAPELYANADVFVNASVIDNQPLSILEAFASGLPVISTPTGDIASMLDGGEFGILVRPRDPEAIASAVEAVAADPEGSRAMARRAYQSLDRFSWENVRDKWLAAYTGSDPTAPGA